MASAASDSAELRSPQLARLREFISSEVEVAPDERLMVEPLTGGLSNLTYRIVVGERSWVLRRPPLGKVLPTAHDMAREHHVLQALAGTDVPVPDPLAYCGDQSVIGAPFYLMEDVDGQILRSVADLQTLGPHQSRAVATELVAVLARLHAVDFNSAGLADFGRPDGYLERQVGRWERQWERSRTRSLPALDEVARRLRAACPPTRYSAVVHGDFRLDNVILADGSTRIVAVLDWEMSTLGDALSDVGFMLMYWDERGPIMSDERLGIDVGFPSRDEMATAYQKQSGRDVDELDFYLVLAHYKVAVIFEGIRARHLAGLAADNDPEGVGAHVETLAERALQIADRSSVRRLRAPAIRGRRTPWRSTG